jgi:asparagine synthetase B (glutamine-hydrolysing)
LFFRYASGTKASNARVLLVGTGADEWFGGYGRHRTAFKRGGLQKLSAEITKDRQRLWWRNLGRDDRVIADHGREARFPFLDEKLTTFVSRIPMQLLVDFSLPPGHGEKKLLRQV